MSTIPVSFVSSLSDSAATALDQFGSVQPVAAGTAFALEGEGAHRVWVVLSGLVKITSLHPDGNELLLAIRGPGELIGELSALDDKPRSASVTALHPTELRSMTVEEFRLYLRQVPDAALALMTQLAGKVREADAHRVSYAAEDIPTRLARCLVGLAEEYGTPMPDGSVEISLPLTQQDLAGLVAGSRDAVAKILQLWRKQGLVTTARKRVVLTDAETLARRHGQLT
jgi:CRP/FNR family transcriptional regulator, cyclic AMP receptor protein